MPHFFILNFHKFQFYSFTYVCVYARWRGSTTNVTGIHKVKHANFFKQTRNEMSQKQSYTCDILPKDMHMHKSGSQWKRKSHGQLKKSQIGFFRVSLLFSIVHIFEYKLAFWVLILCQQICQSTLKELWHQKTTENTWTFFSVQHL